MLRFKCMQLHGLAMHDHRGSAGLMYRTWLHEHNATMCACNGMYGICTHLDGGEEEVALVPSRGLPHGLGHVQLQAAAVAVQLGQQYGRLQVGAGLALAGGRHGVWQQGRPDGGGRCQGKGRAWQAGRLRHHPPAGDSGVRCTTPGGRVVCGLRLPPIMHGW